METKQISITVPTEWSGITLKDYLLFQKDLELYGEEEAGYVACLLHHFCKLPVDILAQLDTDVYLNIKNDLVGFIGNTKLPLQRIIKIGNKEYGFEPNLSKISYGAYLDITKYDTLTIDDNWAKVMSILYRPVVKKNGVMYEIEKYKGDIDEDTFLNLSMDVHFGALHFFLTLLEELQNAILNSLRTEKDLLPNTN